MTSPLEYLNDAGADETDYEQPMRELYSYPDGDHWLNGIVTGVKARAAIEGGALVQFDDRLWVPATLVRESDHYIAVLLNRDGDVYAEVITSLIDGKPAETIRDISVTDGASNIGTEWRPIDEPQTGTRVRYRYTGAAELDQPDESQAY